MPGKPSNRESLLPGKTSNQEGLMPGKSFRHDKITPGKPSYQDKIIPGKPSNQDKPIHGKASHQDKTMSGKPSHEESLLLGNSFSIPHPRGVAGSVTSSFSRRSLMSRTEGKERSLLLMKMKSRLTGLEKDGAQVMAGLEMLENKVKGLVEEAKMTAGEFESEGEAMEKYAGISQYLLQVEDEITIISAALSQWNNDTSDCDVSSVDVLNDESKTKEEIIEESEQKCDLLKKAELPGSISGITNIVKDDILLEDNVEKETVIILTNNLDGKAENYDLANKKERIEISNNLADGDNKKSGDTLEGNVKNAFDVKKQIEAVEIGSNSSCDNFISFNDLNNEKYKATKERFVNKEGIDMNDSSNRKESEDLKEEALVVTKLMKNEEKELNLGKEMESDSLGSTWEEDNTRASLEAPITEKPEWTTLSSVETLETKCKVLEWLENKCEEVNTATPNPRPSSINRATPNPQDSSVNMATPIPRTSSVNMATPNPRTSSVNTTTPNPQASSVNMATHNPRASSMNTATHNPRASSVNMATHNPQASSVNTTTPNPRASSVNTTTPNPRASSVNTTTPNPRTSSVNTNTHNPRASSVNMATPNPRTSSVNTTTPNPRASSVNTATHNPRASSVKSFRAKLKPKQISQSQDKTD